VKRRGDADGEDDDPDRTQPEEPQTLIRSSHSHQDIQRTARNVLTACEWRGRIQTMVTLAMTQSTPANHVITAPIPMPP
jgi:hypothetical protein